MNVEKAYVKLKALGYNALMLDKETILAESSDGKQIYKADDKGDVKSSALYEDLEYNAKSGLTAVKNKGLWGMLDKTLDIKISCIYESVEIIDSFFIALDDGSLVALYNTEFKQLIPSIYKKIISIYRCENNEYIVELLDKQECNIVYRVKGSDALRVPLACDSKTFRLYKYQLNGYIISTDITNKNKLFNSYGVCQGIIITVIKNSDSLHLMLDNGKELTVKLAIQIRRS